MIFKLLQANYFFSGYQGVQMSQIIRRLNELDFVNYPLDIQLPSNLMAKTHSESFCSSKWK